MLTTRCSSAACIAAASLTSHPRHYRRHRRPSGPPPCSAASAASAADSRAGCWLWFPGRGPSVAALPAWASFVGGAPCWPPFFLQGTFPGSTYPIALQQRGMLRQAAAGWGCGGAGWGIEVGGGGCLTDLQNPRVQALSDLYWRIQWAETDYLKSLQTGLDGLILSFYLFHDALARSTASAGRVPRRSRLTAI